MNPVSDPGPILLPDRGQLSQGSILQRAISRAKWEFWRRRSYPIRQRVFDLPPRVIPPGAECELVIMTTPALAADAAWSARSILAGVAPCEAGLHFAIDADASATEESRVRLERTFPGVRISRAQDLAETLQADAPSVVAFSRRNAMGRKLAVTLAANREHHTIYSDSDVVALAPMPEVAAPLREATQACHLQCVAGTCLDPLVAARGRSLGAGICENLNGGFNFAPRAALDLDLAEAMLRGLDFGAIGWFGETVVLATLMHRAHSVPLPRARYVVSNEGQFPGEPQIDHTRIALRHFVTPVRHLLYRQAMPMLWRRWTSA